MPDMFDNYVLACHVELEPVISGSHAVVTGKVCSQRLNPAHFGPFLQNLSFV